MDNSNENKYDADNTTMISMKTSTTTTFCGRNDKNKDIKNNIA